MRRYAPFLLICFLLPLGYIVWFFTAGIDKALQHEYGTPPGQQSITENQIKTVSPPPRPPSFPKNTTLLPAASDADLLHAPDTSSQDDLSLLHTLLRSHRQALGSNPVGLNDEITAALTGPNRKGAASLSPKHPAISEQGELLDRWGIPYRFHAYSGKLMEITSAGPDKKFFTKDDISLRE